MHLKGGEKVVKRTLSFPDELYAKLEELAEKKSVPISSIIKIACSEYLEKEEKK